MVSPERAILGCILQDNSLASVAYSSGIRPDVFQDTRNGAIYQAMVLMNSQEKGIDHVTLHAYLHGSNSLEPSGGSEYVATIGDDFPHTGNFGQYCSLVKEASIDSKLSSGLTEIYSTLETKGGTHALAKAEQVISQISLETYSGGFVRANSVVDDIVLRMEEGEIQSFGLPTGFRALDRMISGLHPGNLDILACRPGMGKTSLALNIAQVTAESGKSVGIASLEMSEEELGFRLLSGKTGLSQEFLKSGKFGVEGWKNVAAARSVISQYPLFIEDYAGITLYELQSNVRRLQAEHGLDLLIVDYLQLMNSGLRSDSRVLEVSDITRGLKILAKSLHIPVLALSQLNRGCEQRTPPRPVLSDLRESGSIEQDADVVMFIYNPSYYIENNNENIVELIVAKNRSGRTGTVKLKWEPDITTFRDLI